MAAEARALAPNRNRGSLVALFVVALAAALAVLPVLPAAAEVVVFPSVQAYDGGDQAVTSDNAPLSRQRVRKLFPPGHEQVIDRSMCRRNIGAVRLWWPEDGASPSFLDDDQNCTTLPALIQSAGEQATRVRSKVRAMGFGSLSGDRRGRGRLPRRILTFTPNGIRNQVVHWPAGGSRALDVFIRPVSSTAAGGDAAGEMFCHPFSNRYASAFGHVDTAPGATTAVFKSILAHELFHAVQCVNPRLGLDNGGKRIVRPVHETASEGTATWFQYIIDPQIAAGPIAQLTDDEYSGSWIFKYFHPSTPVWAICAGYGLSPDATGYGAASMWLEMLKTRPAKTLFRAWRKAKRRQNLGNGNKAFAYLFGKSRVRSAASSLHQSVCRSRIAPGAGTPIEGRSFSADAPTDFVSSVFTASGEPTAVAVPPLSIAAVTLAAGELAPAPFDHVGLDYTGRVRVTVNGAVDATVQTVRESIVAPAGQPTEVATLPGGSVRVSLFNASASATANVSVLVEILQ